ncbi:MAG: rod-binding protein, partial [Planctomycetes bacterium]|nr:rod-binding protein [Planctomycetota bacterium]
TYSDWFDSHMSEHLASSGRVGVADAIVRQLDKLHQIEQPAPRKETIDAVA